MKCKRKNLKKTQICHKDFLHYPQEVIHNKELPYIFEKFYKSHIESNKTGTGLGLAIAYQIAIRHDIELKVESKEGQGTSFRMIFSKRMAM
ncbi:sensor histidine kinase [Sporanaerobium hydrogeniformans]|uniref:sensor histidine kinase n=1 Tax=Sporanaerobium hydrogeniformans TaxID=3072179 RepID=UPI0026BCC368|nr:sensor histidine kinase [Sporanaerobium hydrogeniformans]